MLDSISIYHQKHSFDTLEGTATNPVSLQSGFMGTVLDLGMGFELGRPMERQFSSLAQHINVSEAKKYPHCNSVIDKNSRFCNFCGQSAKSGNWVKSVIKCSACGSKIKPGSKFCPECGTLLKE